jgi:hypothetical protein
MNEDKNEVADYLEISVIKNMARKLNSLGINTIEDLINIDISVLEKQNKMFLPLIREAMYKKGLYFIADKETEKLIKDVIEETGAVMQMLDVIKDSGEYKKRKEWIISDVELKEKIASFYQYIKESAVKTCILFYVMDLHNLSGDFKTMLKFISEHMKIKLDDKNKLYGKEMPGKEKKDV